MFDGISYLGSASITHPKDKTEILRIMAILNGEHVADHDMKISVSIPVSSDGAVMYVFILLKSTHISALHYLSPLLFCRY